MDITNTFDLPLPPATAWIVLLDIPKIMPCIPGTELLEVVDASTFRGKVSVKLGPVQLEFIGTANVLEKNAEAARAHVRAKGNDSKGRGGVLADMIFTVSASAAGSSVTVLTRVSFSGSVAQYGRGTGVIQGIASEIIAQFARNLRESLLRSAVEQQPLTVSASAPPLRSIGADDDPRVACDPPPSPKPIGGVSLMLKVLWSVIRKALRLSQ